MIVVMGHMKFAAGEGAKVAPLLAAHAAEVMKEEGCELYAFSFDAADPDMVRISERWTSPEALGAHGQAPHQKGVRTLAARLHDGRDQGRRLDRRVLAQPDRGIASAALASGLPDA